MSRFKQFLPDVIILVVLLALPLGMFWQQTLGGQTLVPAENLFVAEPYHTDSERVSAPAYPHNHLVSDLVLQNFQWKSFIRAQLAEGEVPLWNPHQFGGIPFLAAGQHSALYPLSIMYYALPLAQAYGWFTVVNLWLAGVFMAAFLRGIGVGRYGALLAGIVYQLSGFALASVVFQMMIGGLPWLPLMLLSSELILRRKALFGRRTALPWVGLGAVALGMNILAGHVEITIYSLLITGFYAGLRWLWDAWQSRDWRDAGRKVAWLLMTLGIGFALGAAQFIPLFEFAQSNWRAERSSYESVVRFAHPPRDVLQFVLPNFYGSPAHHHVLDVLSGEMMSAPWQTLDGNTRTHTEWGIKNYVEAALYLGILPLILAAYALLDRLLILIAGRNRALPANVSREIPYRIIFAVLLVLSLTFMFGLPTYRLIYALPGINQLNSAFRWIYGVTIAVAVLAGFGMDALVRRAAEKQTKLETRLGYLLSGIAVVIVAGLGISYALYPQIEASVASILNRIALAETAFSGPRMFYSYQFGNIAVFATALLLSGVLFIWVGRMRMYRRYRAWSWLVVGLVALDLMVASWGFNPASDPALLDFEPPVVQWLREQDEADGPFRYTTLEDPTQGPLLNANVTWRYGLDDVRGYDSIIPAQYMDYMQSLAPQVQRDFNRIAPLYANADYNHAGDYTATLDAPRLDWLNVRYIVAHQTLDLTDLGWEQVYSDEAVNVWENADALPRAFLVSDTRPDTLSPDSLPDHTEAQILSDSGREKFLAVTLEDEALLVISENFAQGWKAFIRPLDNPEAQEQQLDLERVAEIFQGVQLPAGEWTVRLVYSPTSVQVGFFGSAMGAIVLTLMGGIWLWRLVVGVNTADSSQTAKVARNSIAPIILNLFNRGIDFVLAIIIYRLLSQEMVGVYNFAVVIFVWFDIFTNFGLDVFLMREVSRDRSRSTFYLFNTSLLRVWLSIIGLGLLLLFLFGWQSSIDNPLPTEGLIAILLLYVGLFPASLNKGVTSLYYAYEQAEKPAAIATITSVNKAVFGVIVLLLGWGIVGLAAVSIINNLITLAVLLWVGRHFIDRSLPKRPDGKLLREMVSESWPLMLNHFLATIFFQIDIVILQALRGATAVAQYSTSYKWLLALNIIPAFFTQALFPLLSRQADEDMAAFRGTVRFGIKLLIALALPAAVLFTALAEPLTLILAGPSYLPNGAIALTIMIWSIPIGWMNSLTQYALIALNLQRWITRAFFAAVAFNIISNLIFIPQFGFQAAAITTILSELALFLPFAWLMRRGMGQGLGWLDLMWRPVVASSIMALIMIVMWGIQPIIALMGGSAAYILVLLLLKPLEESELAVLRPMLPQRILNWPVLRFALHSSQSL